MRIHRLSLNAFGPFPGTEQVDLDRLGRDGLFLLTGPTGAGKSTLFEAICFALYGSTTAEGSQGLKSHFAAAESEPWVEMDFTVGVYRYRIRRTPVWSKPSKRAKSGRVTRQASVSLARCPEEQAISREAGAEASRQRDGVHDDSWEMVATRLDEAGRCITELLGLSRSQFAQVVMLPQGRFAQFLAAESKDREALLSTLFPTELYARVQAQLKAEAREAGTLVERSVQRSSWLEEQLEVLLRELADLAETDRAETELSDAVPEHQSPGETMREDAASAGLIERWEEAGGRVRQQHEEVERRREDSLRRLEGHRERLAHLEDAAKQWHEHRELERRRDDLRQRQAEADQRSAALTASRRAEPAARAVHARREADDLLAQRRSQTQQISDELETLPTPAMIAEGLEIDSPPRWLASPDSDQAASGQMRAETSVDALSAGSSGDPDPVRALESVLEAAVKQRHQHDQSAAELDTLRTEHKRLQRRAEEAVSAYVRLAEQRDQLEKDRKIQQEQAGELPALRAAEREAQQHWEAAHRLQSARDQEAERQRGFEQAEERRRKASAQVDQLHRARQEDARAALSQELMPEQPCPVCGSTEHPEPYDPAQASETDDSSDHAEAADQQKNMPISEQLEAVTRERAVAEQRAQRAFEVLSEVRAQIAVLVAALEDDDLSADPERARDLLERAAARRKRAEEAEQRVEALAQQLRQIEEQLTTAESSRAQAHEESVRISGRLREAEERLEKMSVALESLPHREELSHRLQHLQRIRRTLEQLRLAQDRQEQAESTARQRSQQLAQALREGEWNSAEQALDTYLGTEEQDRLGQEVRQDELQRARFDEAWDAAEHQELLRRQDQGETAPTTDQLQQARAQLLRNRPMSRSSVSSPLWRGCSGGRRRASVRPSSWGRSMKISCRPGGCSRSSPRPLREAAARTTCGCP